MAEYADWLTLGMTTWLGRVVSTSLGGQKESTAATVATPASGGNVFDEDPDSQQKVVANIQYLLHEAEEQKPLYSVVKQIEGEVSHICQCGSDCNTDLRAHLFQPARRRV